MTSFDGLNDENNMYRYGNTNASRNIAAMKYIAIIQTLSLTFLPNFS